MTTITLDIPDELAVRLEPLQDRLPKLLSLAIELFPAEMSASIPDAAEKVYPAYKEMMDFLTSSPTPEQIVTYKVSAATQARLEELLDKNREDGLTDDESTELDVYEQVNHFLILLKAHARLRLSSPN